MNKIVIIDEDLCIGCAKCVEICPKKILYIDTGTIKCKVTDESRCDKLAGCQRICPVKAITIQQTIR
jgi:NAD-dependent dihydropyrimidine dehydrogenase PreA subunit